MSKKKVEFFYDVISPYSWFAFEVLFRYQNRWNMAVKLRPFFLGGVMKESGNKPPFAVLNKGVYMYKDIQQLGKYFDVPLKLPKVHEKMLAKGTLPTQRFLTAIDMTHPEMLEKISRELWMRNWNRDEDVTEPSNLALQKKAGMTEENIAAVLKLATDEKVKQRLKQTTQEALDLGAFGAPVITTEVNGQKEWVFGSDRFPILADLLGEKWEGPCPATSNKL
ncbi:glutathione S-transferase kappa 1-like [Physella acuta]|uniref:glutathione S-transferase kappa 1-like n=1 Tax=Physella acuta TaxID=109671 RepID=UPI0027DDA0A7|nr:glutathione S-transferase kappa 1-like [Physella acuta]